MGCDGRHASSMSNGLWGQHLWSGGCHFCKRGAAGCAPVIGASHCSASPVKFMESRLRPIKVHNLEEHEALGPSLRATLSLYNQNDSCVRILGTKSVGVGLHQDCPLSTILFVIFINRISSHSRGEESVQIGNLCRLPDFLHQNMTSSMHLGSLQQDLKWLR